MTNQPPPARPDVDALKKYRLLADRLRWIYEQRSIDLPLAGEVLKKLPEIIFGLDALVATSPARDAAEGGPDCTLWCAMAKHDGVMCPNDSCDIEQGVRAPPKPAPDAVQKQQNRNYAASAMLACIALADEVVCKGGSAVDVASALRDRIAAPVPPADGALDAHHLYFALMGVTSYVLANFPRSQQWNQGGVKVVELATECIEKFKRYDYAAPPPATGAAEPVAYLVLSDNPDDLGITHPRIWWRDKARADAWCAKHNAVPILLYATPPVRGDREAIARIIDPLPFSKLEELDAREAFPNVRGRRGWQARANAALEIADKLVSLPVPPGAGEREADQDRLIAIMALVLQTAQTAFQHPAVSSEAQAAALSSITIALNMEAEHWQKCARLSRQPPQSSSDGEGR